MRFFTVIAIIRILIVLSFSLGFVLYCTSIPRSTESFHFIILYIHKILTANTDASLVKRSIFKQRSVMELRQLREWWLSNPTLCWCRLYVCEIFWYRQLTMPSTSSVSSIVVEWWWFIRVMVFSLKTKKKIAENSSQ